MALESVHYPVHQILDKYFASFINKDGEAYRGIVNIPPYFQRNLERLKGAIIKVLSHEGERIGNHEKIVVTIGEITSKKIEYFSEKTQQEYTIEWSWHPGDSKEILVDLRSFHS